MAMSSKQKQDRKRRLVGKHGAFCRYCKCQLTMNPEKRGQPNYATLDHVIPKSKTWGMVIPDNTVLACKACNGKKGDMTPWQFIQYLGRQSEHPSMDTGDAK